MTAQSQYTPYHRYTVSREIIQMRHERSNVGVVIFRGYMVGSRRFGILSNVVFRIARNPNTYSLLTNFSDILDMLPSYRNAIRLWIQIQGGWVRVLDVVRRV